MVNNQQGVSLIVNFLIMTIIIAIVLSISTILFNQFKVISGIGNSITAFYVADSAMEKTLYFDHKQSGICNMCNACVTGNLVNNCNHCTLTPLEFNGCNVNNCNNCIIKYQTGVNDSLMDVTATVQAGLPNLTIDARGSYKDTTREINK